LTWPLPADLDDAALEARLFRRPLAEDPATRPQPDWAHLHQERKRPGVCIEIGLGCASTGSGYLIPPEQSAIIATITPAVCTDPSDKPGECNKRRDSSFKYMYAAEVVQPPGAEVIRAADAYGAAVSRSMLEVALHVRNFQKAPE
jgi:hypothetical protein